MKIAVILLLAILTALRLWLAGTLTVTPLEAYTWLCAHRMDWAFFDGPGGTAWLVQLGTHLLGDGPLGLRLAFPLLAAAASYGAFLLGRALFGAPAGIWAAVALNALPFFNAAAVHAGPALPALVFILFAAWAFVRALDRGLPWWTLAAVCLAIAAQFHYAAILLLPGLAGACACSSRHRIEWLRPGLYVAAIMAALSLIPTMEWNAIHDWPALAQGTWRTALTPRWSGIGHGIGTTFALFSVFAAGALIFAVWKMGVAARLHFKPRLALCLAAPFALLWLYDVLHGDPGSAALLFVTGILSGAVAHVFLDDSRLHRAGSLTLALTALSAALILSTKEDPWSRSAGGIAWSEVAASLDELMAKAQPPDRPPLLLIAQDPDATSALNYHLASTTHPEVFLRESQDVSNQYGLWPRYDDFVETEKPSDDFFKQEGSTGNLYVGRDALYLTDEEPPDLPQTITGAFANVSLLATLELSGNRKLRVYLCRDYQTMPL